MKKYIGVKIVEAEPITEVGFNDCHYAKGETVECLCPNGEPKVGDILVRYSSDYVAWCPKAIFEAANRPTDGMPFGHAIEAAKQGNKIARAGWNGKGMFVYVVGANNYPAQTGVAKEHFGENAMVPYNAYMALKGVDGHVSTWGPSSTDTLAGDWCIVD